MAPACSAALVFPLATWKTLTQGCWGPFQGGPLTTGRDGFGHPAAGVAPGQADYSQTLGLVPRETGGVHEGLGSDRAVAGGVGGFGGRVHTGRVHQYTVG
ncbi:hypothetical protein GCM10027598_20670 [Amycolatopsis oliviviridis]